MNWHREHSAYIATHNGRRYKVLPHGRAWLARILRFGAPNQSLPVTLGSYPTAAEARAACEGHAQCA